MFAHFFSTEQLLKLLIEFFEHCFILVSLYFFEQEEITIKVTNLDTDTTYL